MRRSGSGVQLKGIKRDRRDGIVYKYHRKTGIRLPDLPENHPDFLKAYLAAEDNGPRKPRNGPGSLESIWSGYLRSDAHKALSASYRRVRERDGAKLVEKAGHVPIRQIKPNHIQKDMAALEPHPANERRKTWRALMAFAKAEHFRDDDPSEMVPRRKTAKAIPHEPWTSQDIAAFRAYFTIDKPERLAFELLHWTGARMSDAVRMGPGMVDSAGWLVYRQQKTGGEVAIPFDRIVPDFADPADLEMLRGCIRPLGMTWMLTDYGSSRSQKAASQWFAAAARKAGVFKTAHGLRKTRAIKLAEAGASTHQIAAWTGHESLKEVERYSRKADRRRILTRPDSEHFLSKRQTS